MRLVTAAAFALFLAGCAGTLDYTPPGSPLSASNSIEIKRSRAEVWKAAVPNIGKQFFVINNLDQSSGLMNLSYSGDPELYVDCGEIRSYVKNARGERTYVIPGARASATYEVMNPQGLFLMARQTKLEGRVNLIFEELSPDTTRVTANTRYIFERDSTARDVNNIVVGNRKDAISFNSGQSASFPPGQDGRSLSCRPNGKLETDLLRLVQ